jgi:Uma2 family endonuclease
MYAHEWEEKLKTVPMLPKVLQQLHTFLDTENTRRNEFREWLNEDHKAEFINGHIIMHSPAADMHNESVGLLHRASSLYVDVRKIGKVRMEKAMVALTRNDYEPDIAFWKKEKAAKILAEHNVYPAPDWIVEVLSKGSVKRDRVVKFADYAAHGIAEYWIIDPKKRIVEQYILTDEEATIYALKKKATIDDTLESEVMEGFKIPVRAIFDAEVNAEFLTSLISSIQI